MGSVWPPPVPPPPLHAPLMVGLPHPPVPPRPIPHAARPPRHACLAGACRPSPPPSSLFPKSTQAIASSCARTPKRGSHGGGLALRRPLQAGRWHGKPPSQCRTTPSAAALAAVRVAPLRGVKRFPSGGRSPCGQRSLVKVALPCFPPKIVKRRGRSPLWPRLRLFFIVPARCLGRGGVRPMVSWGEGGRAAACFLCRPCAGSRCSQRRYHRSVSAPRAPSAETAAGPKFWVPLIVATRSFFCSHFSLVGQMCRRPRPRDCRRRSRRPLHCGSVPPL